MKPTILAGDLVLLDFFAPKRLVLRGDILWSDLTLTQRRTMRALWLENDDVRVQVEDHNGNLSTRMTTVGWRVRRSGGGWWCT